MESTQLNHPTFPPASGDTAAPGPTSGPGSQRKNKAAEKKSSNQAESEAKSQGPNPSHPAKKAKKNPNEKAPNVPSQPLEASAPLSKAALKKAKAATAVTQTVVSSGPSQPHTNHSTNATDLDAPAQLSKTQMKKQARAAAAVAQNNHQVANNAPFASSGHVSRVITTSKGAQAAAKQNQAPPAKNQNQKQPNQPKNQQHTPKNSQHQKNQQHQQKNDHPQQKQHEKHQQAQKQKQQHHTPVPSHPNSAPVSAKKPLTVVKAGSTHHNIDTASCSSAFPTPGLSQIPFFVSTSVPPAKASLASLANTILYLLKRLQELASPNTDAKTIPTSTSTQPTSLSRADTDVLLKRTVAQFNYLTLLHHYTLNSRPTELRADANANANAGMAADADVCADMDGCVTIPLHVRSLLLPLPKATSHSASHHFPQHIPYLTQYIALTQALHRTYATRGGGLMWSRKVDVYSAEEMKRFDIALMSDQEKQAQLMTLQQQQQQLNQQQEQQHKEHQQQQRVGSAWQKPLGYSSILTSNLPTDPYSRSQAHTQASVHPSSLTPPALRLWNEFPERYASALSSVGKVTVGKRAKVTDEGAVRQGVLQLARVQVLMACVLKMRKMHDSLRVDTHAHNTTIVTIDAPATAATTTATDTGMERNSHTSTDTGFTDSLAEMNANLTQLLQTQQPSKEEKSRRSNAIREFAEGIEWYSNKKYTVVAVGSMASGLDGPTSDLDLGIVKLGKKLDNPKSKSVLSHDMTRGVTAISRGRELILPLINANNNDNDSETRIEEEAMYLRKLLKRCRDWKPRNAAIESVIARENMRVPLAKLRYLDRVDVDLGILQLESHHNPRLASAFAAHSSLFLPLVRVVKMWAKKRDIVDASQAYLNSWTLVLFVAQYMQLLGLLPVVQAASPECPMYKYSRAYALAPPQECTRTHTDPGTDTPAHAHTHANVDITSSIDTCVDTSSVGDIGIRPMTAPLPEVVPLHNADVVASALLPTDAKTRLEVVLQHLREEDVVSVVNAVGKLRQAVMDAEEREKKQNRERETQERAKKEAQLVKSQRHRESRKRKVLEGGEHEEEEHHDEEDDEDYEEDVEDVENVEEEEKQSEAREGGLETEEEEKQKQETDEEEGFNTTATSVTTCASASAFANTVYTRGLLRIGSSGADAYMSLPLEARTELYVAPIAAHTHSSNGDNRSGAYGDNDAQPDVRSNANKKTAKNTNINTPMNTPTLAELFHGFLAFYAYIFDPRLFAVNVRRGHLVWRASLNSTFDARHAVVVEEPFVPSQNTARALTPLRWESVQAEFRRAALLLSVGMGLDAVMETWEETCKVLKDTLASGPHALAKMLPQKPQVAAATLKMEVEAEEGRGCGSDSYENEAGNGNVDIGIDAGVVTGDDSADDSVEAALALGAYTSLLTSMAKDSTQSSAKKDKRRDRSNAAPDSTSTATNGTANDSEGGCDGIDVEKDVSSPIVPTPSQHNDFALLPRELQTIYNVTVDAKQVARISSGYARECVLAMLVARLSSALTHAARGNAVSTTTSVSSSMFTSARTIWYSLYLNVASDLLTSNNSHYFPCSSYGPELTRIRKVWSKHLFQMYREHATAMGQVSAFLATKDEKNIEVEKEHEVATSTDTGAHVPAIDQLTADKAFFSCLYAQQEQVRKDVVAVAPLVLVVGGEVGLADRP